MLQYVNVRHFFIQLMCKYNRGAGQHRYSRRQSRRERLNSLVFTEYSGVKIQCSDLLDEAATRQANNAID